MCAPYSRESFEHVTPSFVMRELEQVRLSRRSFANSERDVWEKLTCGLMANPLISMTTLPFETAPWAAGSFA